MRKGTLPVRRPSARRVAVVGQTPPPHHGQAVMLELLVRADFGDVEVDHVRMAFSAGLADVGRFQVRKLAHLASIVPRILLARLRGATVLYYPPASPHRVPILRDAVILTATRWAFPVTVFHFHAGGLGAVLPSFPAPLRAILRRAYGRPDIVVRLSARTPEDGRALGAREEYLVPNGIPAAPAAGVAGPTDAGTTRLLYLGTVRESKGVLVLIAACALLRDRGERIRCEVVGGFASADDETAARDAVTAAGLDAEVRLRGPLLGAEKAAAYRDADIFCFPSFYSSENFPVVVLEAMQASLPVVATDWRGIPDLVVDGETGVLIPPRDPVALANALTALIRDPERAARLGTAGHRRYLAEYTLERYVERSGAVLRRALELADDGRDPPRSHPIERSAAQSGQARPRE